MALVELRIRDLAVIRAAGLQPGSGLTVLTGETGSGKSVCITALRLVLGGPRPDADVVGGEAPSATVAAVFDAVPPPVRAHLQSHGIPDDDLLTLTRELPRAGRGACRINGALVSLAVLRSVGEELVEVTAQGESHRLLRPAHQRALLDAWGGQEVAAARGDVGLGVSRWRAARSTLERLDQEAAVSAERLASARALVAELEPLGLRVGEDEQLAAERLRLRSCHALATACAAVRAACAGSDDSRGAADLCATAARLGRGVAGVDAGVDALLEACADEAESLRELASRARALEAALEVDDHRLAVVEERLDVIARVRRRYNGRLEDAVAMLAEAKDLIDHTAAAGDRVRLEAEVEDAAGAAAAAAQRLTRARAVAAARLEDALTRELHQLRMPAARVRVVLSRTPDPTGLTVGEERVQCGPEGTDTVEFRLATTRDGVPIPLSEGISGGELSRLALAIRAVVGEADAPPTLVLDEVDAGLGGETAERVGDLLGRLGRVRQVVVVTHRPEIAARASDHIVVHRFVGAATSTVGSVAGDARVIEIARLMSGRATDAALTRARELLSEGAEEPTNSTPSALCLSSSPESSRRRGRQAG